MEKFKKPKILVFDASAGSILFQKLPSPLEAQKIYSAQVRSELANIGEATADPSP